MRQGRNGLSNNETREEWLLSNETGKEWLWSNNETGEEWLLSNNETGEEWLLSNKHVKNGFCQMRQEGDTRPVLHQTHKSGNNSEYETQTIFTSTQLQPFL